MLFVSSKKRYRIVIEPEVPQLVNSAGQVTQFYVPPIYVQFEEGEGSKGYYDTDAPNHVWNQAKNVIKGLGNAKLKERVENAIKHSKGWEAGWVKEWTKPKKYKLVEMADEDETKPDFVTHQDAQVPSEAILEKDAKKIMESLNK